MQVNIIMQRENQNTMAEVIEESMENNAKKAYFFVGNFKETGFKILEDSLYDTKTKLYFAIGIDKKNTTRSMLEGLLKYTKDVYFYSNNNVAEFVSNICIFEYTNKAELYVNTTNVSESGLLTDVSLYTKITYDLKDTEDKNEYKKQIKELTKMIEELEFTKLDKSKIDELVETKEIFSTRQYNHNVMSISELLGKKGKETKTDEKKELTKEEVDDVFVQNIEIPKVDLSDIAIDIDIPEEISQQDDDLQIDYEEEKITLPDDIEQYEEIEDEYSDDDDDDYMDNLDESNDEIDVNNELYDESLASDDVDLTETLDINDMLFSKADIKLDMKAAKQKKKTTKKQTIDEEVNVVKVKKVNLNNISSLIFQVAERGTKESEVIKVPNHVKMMIPEFFGLDAAENEEINDTTYKVKKIKLEIVDVKNNKTYKDDTARMMYKPRASFLTFVSGVLSTIEYSDEDIVRIIKEAEDKYHIEIVDKGLQEYKVWSKLCNQTFRNSTKKFGLM